MVDVNPQQSNIIITVTPSGSGATAGVSYGAEIYAERAKEYSLQAGTSATLANISKNNSSIWAEGTDAEVQELGGVHSAKGWAEEVSTSSADIDLSNLSATGEGHFAKLDASNFNKTGKSTLSGFSMPSTRYTDLTFGARGTNYIAPANGYYFTQGNATSDYGYVGFRYMINQFEAFTNLKQGANAYGLYLLTPVKKGQTIVCDYYNYTPAVFRFIYAEGEAD